MGAEVLKNVMARPEHAVWDPSQRIFKFIDPTTGLWWSGNLRQNSQSLFNERGIEFKSKKAADEAWRTYEVHRAERPELPPLKRKVFKVIFEEEGEEEFTPDEATLVVTRFVVKFGKQSHLTQFVRQLQDSAPGQFRFIIERKIGGKPRQDMLDVLAAMNAPRLSSNQSKKRFVAVRSEADLIYLRMGISEQYSRAFDIQTAKEL